KPHTAPLVFWTLIFWIAGILIFYSYIIIFNIKFYRKTNDRKLITDERIWHIAEQCRKQLRIKKPIPLFETGAVEEPCIYGLLNPVILVPKNMINTLSDIEVRCVLTHEFIHYKKKDNIFNLFTMIINSIHWFNPLVHIAFFVMRHDNELLCDYRSLKHMAGERYAYEKTLLKLACSQGYNKLVISESIVGNKKGLKERIVRIAKNTGYRAIWSVVAVLMIIVVGCTGLSNEKEPAEAERYANLEPVKLNFYTRGYSDKPPEIGDILKEIELRLADSLMITPVFHWIPYENYTDELKRLISSGEDVDAFTDYGIYSVMQETDIVKDISALFPQYAPNYYKELKSTKAGEMLLQSVTYNDRLYMIPWNYFNCPRYCIVARKDLVSKYADKGFDTLEEYGDFLKAVKENENGIIPGVVHSSDFFDAYIKGNGYYSDNATWFYSNFSDKQHTIYPITDLTEFIDAYNLIKNWKDNGYVAKANLSYYSTEYMTLGWVASMIYNGRNLDQIKSVSPGKYEYGIYNLYMNSTQLLSVSSQGIIVSKYSKNPERVLMFLEWLHASQENYDLFMYGIEGVNYELKGDNIYIPSNVKSKMSWDIGGAEFFKDNRFIRSSLFDTKEYRNTLLDASLKNVITSEELKMQIFGKNSYGLAGEILKDEEWLEESTRMQQNLQNLFDKFFSNSNMKTFCKNIDNGVFIHTPQQLQEMQKEAGVDDIVEYYEEMFERYKR
ncbi:MAG: extracellular solute-binding protein, partial [Clostridiaceae bacterium]|nr:extracellular solute-binding protein [Clostridiaceae bacterium]